MGFKLIEQMRSGGKDLGLNSIETVKEVKRLDKMVQRRVQNDKRMGNTQP